MEKLKLLLLSFVMFNSASAQLDSTILFEQSKGTWNYPMQKVTKIRSYKNSQTACATVNGSIIMSTTFISDSSYSVLAVYDGLISSIQQIEGAYAIITEFGDYFITYYGLTKPILKKGDFVKKGQILTYLQENSGEEFFVEVYVSNSRKTLDSFFWFACKSCP